MKKLYIIRHAKSSWEYDVIDHERPLNTRGEKDAEMVAKNLKSYALKPDLILSSDAIRARMTAAIFMENLNLDINNVKLNHELYDFAGHNLLEVIKNCKDSVNKLMIFGHNYAITAFVNDFGSTHIENVPTSGVVLLEFDIEKWKDLKRGKTIAFVSPKDIKE